MESIFDKIQFALQVAWYRVQYDISGHITLIVVVVAIILLIWIFLSPSVRRRG